jgi:hypothetical protein
LFPLSRQENKVRIWIDNTGFQSAGLCLEGRSRSALNYDVRGLFQLATLLIYGNHISLNGFEGEPVAQRSQAILDRLGRIGVGHDILSISPVDEVEYARACKAAADSVAPNLADSFNPHEYALIGVEPPDLPRGTAKRQVMYFDLAREREGSARLQEIREHALKDNAPGAVDYMMASSETLRESVARIRTKYPSLAVRERYDLNVLLRYHLNDALAELAHSKYAPAIGRAERVSQRNRFVANALNDVLDDTVEELRSKLGSGPLGVPSFTAALLQRSKGDPEGVITVAMEFRERSKPLRNALGDLAVKYREHTPELYFELRKKIAELGAQLRRDVGLDEKATPWGAIDVKLVIGVPVPSISIEKLVKWLRELEIGNQTAVLTELVKASAFSDLPGPLYKELCRLSSKRATR